MSLINFIQGLFSRNVEFGGTVSDAQIHLTQDYLGYDNESLKLVEPEKVQASSIQELFAQVKTIDSAKTVFSNPYICRELFDGRTLLNANYGRQTPYTQCLRVADSFNREYTERAVNQLSQSFPRNIGFWGPKPYCTRTSPRSHEGIQEECTISLLRDVF